MNILLFAALTGCAPNDADVSGDWFVWLAAGSSTTIDREALDISKATHFECKNKWDAKLCAFEPAYAGPTSGGYDPNDNYIGGDCKRLNDAGNEDPGDGICDGDYTEDCNQEDMDGFAAECAELEALNKNSWIVEDGFYGLSGEMDPWRSEALINSEGDLQLTVHVELEEADGADAQDFRFHFSIDPNFAPDVCLENEDGDTVREFQDGSNWIHEWSEDEDGNQIFYLNAGAFQIDPNDAENSWYLSDDMVSGYGFSKYAEEEFSSEPTAYGHYNPADSSGLKWGSDALGFGDLTGGFLGVSSVGHAGEVSEAGNFGYVDWYEQYTANFDQLCSTVLGAACENYDDDGVISWQEEMTTVLGAVTDSNTNGLLDEGEARFEHKIETNMWRPIDGTVSGLDGWMEVHSSWIRLQTGQTVAPGEKVKGDYQIFYSGQESGSRLLVRGEFEITELDMDRWGYDLLEDVKREENGTPYCGGAEAP
jgi:hypothetical protein